MNLVRWNTLPSFDDLFDSWFDLRRRGGQAPTDRGWSPVVDIHEDGDAYRIAADLPGVRKEDLKVQVRDGALTLSGERHAEARSEEGKAHRIERFHGSFERRFTLPEDVDADAVTAEFRDGVLSVVLPKQAPKEVEVKEVQVL